MSKITAVPVGVSAETAQPDGGLARARHRVHRMGRALVSRRLHLRGDCRDGGFARRHRQRCVAACGERGVRQRILEPDHLHDADGVRGDRRLRGRDLGAGAAADPRPCRAAANRDRSGRARRRRVHDRLAAQLGVQPDLGGLLVRALAARRELRMDYRAAGAAAYLGLGATWAMGLSSSAAQLQANPASMPKSLLAITGVIPFTETIFMWQSFVITAVLLVVSVTIAISSAPGPERRRDGRGDGDRDLARRCHHGAAAAQSPANGSSIRRC